jgi:hypothetical protein
MNNNTNSRSLYDVGFLDELHQVFPEILYDSILFPHEDTNSFGRMLSWVRFRLASLYPQTFHRERQSYAQNTAQERRDNYDEWLWLRAIREAPVVRTPQRSQRSYANTSPLQSFLNSGLSGQPRNTLSQDSRMDDNNIQPRFHMTSVAGSNVRNTLFDELISSLLIPQTSTGIRTIWTGFYDPVLVYPTAVEIEAGSQIVASNSVASDALCTICQEHDSPRDSDINVSNGWRRLINCTHIFHKNCIDRWFREHVICPVCRADIRTAPTVPTVPTVPTGQTPSSPSLAESGADMGLP